MVVNPSLALLKKRGFYLTVKPITSVILEQCSHRLSLQAHWELVILLVSNKPTSYFTHLKVTCEFYQWTLSLLFSHFVILTADLSLVQPHIMHIIAFLEVIATDQDHSESNVSNACGLVG